MNRDCFSIAVVEDNEWYNKLLVHTLSLNPDYSVKSYLTARDFLNAAGKMPSVVTLDMRLPDMNGIELLAKIKEISPDTEVIVISEQDNIQTAVDLMKNGVYDYIVKEKDIRNRLHITIEKIRNNSKLITKIADLQQELESKYDLTKSIVGSSAALQDSIKLIEKTLNNSITVMITGETGTGKEVVAKAIHYNSNRSSRNFVAVNLAAIPSELIESELFGHEKGSFTGASVNLKKRIKEHYFWMRLENWSCRCRQNCYVLFRKKKLYASVPTRRLKWTAGSLLQLTEISGRKLRMDDSARIFFTGLWVFRLSCHR